MSLREQIARNAALQVALALAACNGEKTAAKSETPDLILMDVVMPGTSGFQATRTITRDEIGRAHV